MSDSEDAYELKVLTSKECQRLLASHEVGRLGVIADHYPLIVPVNYALDGGTVVFRTSAGMKLAALDHANVTFEVDDIDRDSRSGWSVLVRGLAEEVTPGHGSELMERTKASQPEPWAPGERQHWVRIIPHEVTGRRIALGVPPAIGYL